MNKYFDLKFTCNFVHLKTFFLVLYIFVTVYSKIVLIVYRILWVYSESWKKAEEYLELSQNQVRALCDKSYFIFLGICLSLTKEMETTPSAEE